MQIRSVPIDTDVPFFPFPLVKERGNGHYLTTNHHINRPVQLNYQAAEILRLADGATPLSAIVDKLASTYSECGGPAAVRPQVVNVLRWLSDKELIWWREIPLEPVPAGAPSSIFWEITTECNLRCRHCVVSGGVRKLNELPLERCLSLIDEMAALGVEIIAFSGGEPLVHPAFYILAEKVSSRGMHVQVATNGTLITRSIAKQLLDLGADVQVSLDGSTPEIHNRQRPGSNAFERTITGIQALVAVGHPVTVATVLSTLNLADIPNLLQLIVSLGVAGFRLIPFVPKGRGEFNKEMEVTNADIESITRYIHSQRDKLPLNIAPLEFEEMLEDNICFEAVSLNQHIGCNGAFDYATITPSGEVLPCHFFEGVRADKVDKISFGEVWHSSRFLNYFRHLTLADLHGKCRDCNWLPRCRGSCRAVNFAKGDLFGSNKGCWIK